MKRMNKWLWCSSVNRCYIQLLERDLCVYNVCVKEDLLPRGQAEVSETAGQYYYFRPEQLSKKVIISDCPGQENKLLIESSILAFICKDSKALISLTEKRIEQQETICSSKLFSANTCSRKFSGDMSQVLFSKMLFSVMPLLP